MFSKENEKMILLFLIVLCIIGAIVVPRMIPDKYNRRTDEPISMGVVRWAIRGGFIVIGIACFLMTSCLVIDSDSVGHLKRIYMGTEMPPGRIIAAQNEKGPQARILPPGFHLIPFIRVTHDIEEKPIVSIEQGKYGYLVAKDGRAMPPDQFIAPAWDSASNMIDSVKFMGYAGDEKTEPLGVKGPQLTVLPPGDWRINRYLFDVYEGNATDVPIGHVAVVKSNVGDHYTGSPILPTGVESTTLSVPIVPKGYKGVWDKVLMPDRYYLNTEAYDITIIPTQIQTWKYIGGYTRRQINLVLTDEGKIEQSLDSHPVPVPEDSADASILLRVENWDVFQDARVQVQVTPENAPFVVAAAGGITAIEDKIMTPTFRSVLRNEVAKNVTEDVEVWDKAKNAVVTKEVIRPRQVLDLLYKREALEGAVEKKLIPEGAKYGLTVMEVRFGDPSVPPELLLPGKRKQLAESLVSTYKQEKLAQFERVESEKERARADQQGELMKSEIGIKVAENNALAKQKEGDGQRKYLEAVAKGQEAQANVLGKEKAFELAYVKEVLAAAASNPQMIKVPNTFVIGGDGGGLTGAAAVLGANNITMGLSQRVPKQ
jgi:hypothetical protein